MKQCEVCGKKLPEQPKYRKYCQSCAIEMARKQRGEAYNRHKSRSTTINGQTDQLSRDIHNSIEMGVSYGVYMGWKREYHWI